MGVTPEKTYAIKWYNNPGDLGVWNSWQEKAKTDDHAKSLAERISKRPAVEFYDTHKDPYELNNLAGNSVYAKQIEKLKGALSDWMAQQGDEGASVDRVYPKKN